MFIYHNRKELNDPFELTTPLPEDKKEIEEIKTIEKKLNDKFGIHKEAYLNERCVNIQEVTDKSEKNERLHDILTATRVACFTKKFDNLPMWAYYAGNHMGFVLGYEKDSLSPKIKKSLYKVCYREELMHVPHEVRKLILKKGSPKGIVTRHWIRGYYSKKQRIGNMNKNVG